MEYVIPGKVKQNQTQLPSYQQPVRVLMVLCWKSPEYLHRPEQFNNFNNYDVVDDHQPDQYVRDM